MERRKVAGRPDPEWVAGLKEGDRVSFAEYGREVGSEQILLRKTPGGLLKVGDPHSALRHAVAYYGAAPGDDRRSHMAGYRRGGTVSSTPRYLVPPADAESLRTKGQP